MVFDKKQFEKELLDRLASEVSCKGAENLSGLFREEFGTRVDSAEWKYRLERFAELAATKVEVLLLAEREKTAKEIFEEFELYFGCDEDANRIVSHKPWNRFKSRFEGGRKK